MADEFERDEPVLVRPYINTRPGGGTAEHDDRREQTWPASANLPDDGTRELARVTEPVTDAAAVRRTTDAAAKSTALRRQRFVVLAWLGALAAAGAAGLVLLLPSGDDEPPATARPVAPTPGLTGSVAAAAPVASQATRRASPGVPSARRPSAAGRSSTAPAPAAPGQATRTAPASGRPSATLAPPPAAARTGPITAAGGRCLNLGGLFAADRTPVNTADCSGVSYQRWTLASDGTLLVAGRCAQVEADATVRLGACDRPAAQWRAGPNGSLVNPATGRCLTDPGTLGTTVTVTGCTGAATQRWTVP